jgi:uncharacterized membrane protein YdjX (TVP38/TMEM64 family)
LIKKTSAALVGLLVLASPLVLTLPWKEWVAYGALLRTMVHDLGHWAPALFMLVTALGTALGLPRLIFCTAGGWLFGFEYGFAWSHVGSLIGAWGLFIIARHTRPETLLNRYPKLKALSKPVGRGWFSVLVVRQLPLAGLYNDILLAWSPVSHRDFWIGSFIGFLPLGLTASLAGAGIIQADLGRTASYLAGATLVFLLLTFAVKWLIRRRDPSAAEVTGH